MWDYFSDLLYQQFVTGEEKHQKEAKLILQKHLIETQNQRPEFMFFLMLIYFRQKKF